MVSPANFTAKCNAAVPDANATAYLQPILSLINISTEDAAESMGALYKGVQTGNFGLVGCLSGNGNKIITGSSGGFLLTDDLERLPNWTPFCIDTVNCILDLCWTTLAML